MMKLLASMGFSMGAFITLIEILVAYIKKKKVNTLQNTLFVAITIFCLLSCLSEFAYTYLISIKETIPPNSILMACILYVFFNLFTMYFTICYIIAYRTTHLDDKKRKKIRLSLFSIFLVIYLICFFVACNSQIEIHDDFLYQFTGPGMSIVSAICYGIFILSIFGLFIKNKELSKKQLFPLIYAVMVVLIVFALQLFFDYDFNYLTYLLTFLLAAIFFTTENQDFKLLEELEESKKIVDEENVAQAKFLENISHEIRSPLNNIIGLSDILVADQEQDLSKIKEDVSNIRDSSLYLLKLTYYINEISQIESEKDKINEAEYDLNTLIHDIKEDVNTKLSKEEVEFSLNFDEKLPKRCYGDFGKIKRIIYNVLLNAFYYTHKGKVSLDINEIERDNKEIKIEFLISNTGHLMKEEDFEREIQDFFENNISNLDINDNNIALMVAKSLISMLGGEIKFANETGKGTRYFITIKQLIVDSTNIGNEKPTNNEKEQDNNSSLEVNA